MTNKDTPNPALEAAMADIEKTYGVGSIARMDAQRDKVDVIPTGILTLDLALGAGGLPRGRIITLKGPYGGGKSTLLQHLVAEEQTLGGTCAFIDLEYGLDPAYATSIGVNVADLLISQPTHGEAVFGIVEKLVDSGAVSLIAVDSAAAIVPKAELEGDYGQANVGLQARLFSQSMRKLVGKVGRNNVALVFTNQIREKIGVIYGSPETDPGGRALPFYSSVIIDIRRKEFIKDGQLVTGNEVQFKIPKNRVGAPYQEARADIEYGLGFSKQGALLDVAVDREIINKSGSWYTYMGDQLGQGKEKAKARLTTDTELYNEINQRVRRELAE